MSMTRKIAPSIVNHFPAITNQTTHIIGPSILKITARPSFFKHSLSLSFQGRQQCWWNYLNIRPAFLTKYVILFYSSSMGTQFFIFVPYLNKLFFLKLKADTYYTFTTSQLFLILTEISIRLHNLTYVPYTCYVSKTRKLLFAFLWNLYLKSPTPSL